MALHRRHLTSLSMSYNALRKPRLRHFAEKEKKQPENGTTKDDDKNQKKFSAPTNLTVKSDAPMQSAYLSFAESVATETFRRSYVIDFVVIRSI
jgi:hypothetical protein